MNLSHYGLHERSRMTTGVTRPHRALGALMRIAVATAVACLSLVGIAAADQAQAAVRKNTTIPAQGLGPALQQLAQERGIQLVYRSELVSDRSSAGAVGDLTIDEALTQILKGTGITFRYLANDAITLVPTKGMASGQHTSGAGTPISYSITAGAASLASSGDVWSRFRFLQADGGGSAAPGPIDAQSNLEEIIVTAQRREERLQDVPISISVLTGIELDRSRADGITEALSRVPGVATTVNFQSSATQLSVRGVTAATPLFSGSNPIGYYIDSVPFALVKSAIAPDSNAYDLERVEVLRGPQGTLYGASALNGVVRVLTHDATLDRFEFKGRASGSSTDSGGQNYRADMALNVPIIAGKLAARAVVGYQDLSGWIDKPNDKDANSQQISNIRLKLNAQPTDALSLGLSAWRSRTDGDAPSTSADGKTSASMLKEPYSTDYDAYGLKIGYEFSTFSLLSSTSYLDYENPAHIDYFGYDAFTGLDSNIFSQEINLNSTAGGSWRWALGAFYRKGEDELTQLITLNGAVVVPLYQWRDNSESTAVFGEITRVFLDGRYELTGGLRYFEDTVTSNEGSVDAPPLLKTKSKFDALTPRVVLTWHPTEAATVYGSYAEGFRSGFDQYLFSKTVLNAPPIEPDKLKNYELGTKGSLSSGRFSYEAAVYYIDWQDVQQSLTIVPADGIPRAGNTNGGSASGVGVELAASTRVVDGLDVGVNFSWNDLTTDDAVVAHVFSASLGDFQDVVLFGEGDRLNSSPEYTAGVFADYSFPLGAHGLEGKLSASANYVSEQEYRSLLGGGVYHTVGDAMLIARAAFSIDANDRWAATLFAENLNNERGTPLKAPIGVPDFSARVRPRTIGLQLEYRFD